MEKLFFIIVISMEKRIHLLGDIALLKKKCQILTNYYYKNLQYMALTRVREAITFRVYFLQLIRSVFI